MDWQQATALLIVGATACAFAYAKARSRKFSMAKDTHCGCATAGDLGPKQSIRFSARKGERPRVIIKNP